MMYIFIDNHLMNDSMEPCAGFQWDKGNSEQIFFNKPLIMPMIRYIHKLGKEGTP